jgi:4-cresol dehydrogenase (hydroxylating)
MAEGSAASGRERRGNGMLNEEVVRELERIVGAERLCADPEEVRRRTCNTLGLERRSLGIIYPETVEQVEGIVQLANRHRFVLYPYSTAKNIGYGERLPVTENNLVVDLRGMNRIVHVDSELGYADVEPGVTQSQLSEYLAERDIPFFVDATAGRDSSLVGNSLEGGFGSTPRGNKRKEITCVQGVFGNGERFDTGYFPGSIGPDLAGIFVQSNYAIITQLRITLNRVFDDYRSFSVGVHGEPDLLTLVDALRELRQQGTIINQVVIANAIDAMAIVGAEVPKTGAGQPLTNIQAAKILSKPFIPFAPISAFGAVYGTRAEVWAKRQAVRRVLRKHLGNGASIRYLSNTKLGLVQKIVSSWPLSRIPASAEIAHMLDYYEAMHGIMQGTTSDAPVIGLLGGVKETYEEKRLMWYSSGISSRAEDVDKFTRVVSQCYERHGFPYPLEMLLVTPNDIESRPHAGGVLPLPLGRAEPRRGAVSRRAETSAPALEGGIRPRRCDRARALRHCAVDETLLSTRECENDDEHPLGNE